MQLAHVTCVQPRCMRLYIRCANIFAAAGVVILVTHIQRQRLSTTQIVVRYAQHCTHWVVSNILVHNSPFHFYAPLHHHVPSWAVHKPRYNEIVSNKRGNLQLCCLAASNLLRVVRKQQKHLYMARGSLTVGIATVVFAAPRGALRDSQQLLSSKLTLMAFCSVCNRQSLL